jgi:type II secretory pathway pseudopilin PulG
MPEPFRRRCGLTRLELLIVLSAIIVLAATLVPRLFSSPRDSRYEQLKFDLHTLRTQIELYKLHHLGEPPLLRGGSLPQLFCATDVAGNPGPSGAQFPFGPYLVTGMPANPFNGRSSVEAAARVPPQSASGEAGWLYDAASGQIWANTQDLLDL